MIDYIKIKITDNVLINRVWNNPVLEYDGKSEKRFKDEVRELITRKYKNLYFVKYDNRLEIKGSIHYYFNEGLHNANDFYIPNCIATIIQLRDIFNLDLDKCFLINLEYGVNVLPDIPINDLIVNLIYHEKRQFVRATEHTTYKIAGNDAYKQIKAYAKGVQFPHYCNPNTFRFEVKSKQAKFIQSLGLYTLADLTNIDNYNLLINSLIKEWDNVLLFDLSKNIDTKFFNTHFWEQLINEAHRNKFNNQKKLYFKKLGNDNLHFNIKKIIDQKTKYLKSVQIPTTINLETAQVKILF
jgi:hypothetical protein